ncbi:MAG TPA: efflux RND transporter periplasmic adaptor subunit [Candidatus Coprenecus stercoripullorum]|nr:efflux RND transporter periplasmic adaptor subunit [Candidatus Coprenecus stercoripullorum]
MAKKNKNTNMKWLAIAGLLVVAVLLVIVVSRKDTGIRVTLGTPQTGRIVETIPANGKIQPVTEVKISPDVSGEIVELNVEEGDRVLKGDLIIKIKQDVYISARDRAEASLNSIKAQYLQQEAQFRRIEAAYERNVQLYGRKAISEQEYETSLADYQVAKEQLSAARFDIAGAEATLQEAEENLVKTTIYSPIDGIVSSLSVEKGERVVGTSQMAGTEMLRIADFAQMEVLVDVNENDIIRVAHGDTAIISVDAWPGKEFSGIVTKVANSAKNIDEVSADQVTNFEVTVEILQDSYKALADSVFMPFRPGMSASVEILTSVKDSVLKVPLQAVAARDDVGTGISGKLQEYVFLYDREQSVARAVRVVTGIQDIDNIEITEGLQSDSVMLIVGPYNVVAKQLMDGMHVTLSSDNGNRW